MHLDCIRLAIEAVFAGLEQGVTMESVPDDKPVPAADDACRLELPRDAPGRISGTQHDERLSSRGKRDPQAPDEPSDNGQDDK
jgi:hypothetical protein